MIRKARLYVLRDPYTMEIRYVGVTVWTLRARLSQHWCGKARDKTHRANWLRKLKRRGVRPIIELVREVPIDKAYAAERKLISQFRRKGFRLVNVSAGGEGETNCGRHHDKWEAVITAYKQLKSVRAAAAATGVSKNGVAYILAVRGVKMYPRNRPGAENSGVKSIDPGSARGLVRDVGVMTQLYLVERLSIPDIAKQLDTGQTSVFNGLVICGIARRSKSESVWLAKSRRRRT